MWKCIWMTFWSNPKKYCFILDLEETFSTLREYEVKLNPDKYTFGVKSGTFLGFMVTKRGIEVNPSKVQAVFDMSSPSSVNDVQKLTGKIAALSRFISWSVRSHPFYQVLWKTQKFNWDDRCEKTFWELKIHLAKFPLLIKPKLWEDCGFIYLLLSMLSARYLSIRKWRIIGMYIMWATLWKDQSWDIRKWTWQWGNWCPISYLIQSHYSQMAHSGKLWLTRTSWVEW